MLLKYAKIQYSNRCFCLPSPSFFLFEITIDSIDRSRLSARGLKTIAKRHWDKGGNTGIRQTWGTGDPKMLKTSGHYHDVGQVCLTMFIYMVFCLLLSSCWLVSLSLWPWLSWSRASLLMSMNTPYGRVGYPPELQTQIWKTRKLFGPLV